MQGHGRRGAIAVTGACGFVCANVVRDLARRGHRVIAADLTPPPDPLRQAWTNLAGSVRWLPLDVASEGGWTLLDEEPVERIIHGAAVTPGGSDPEPARTARVNLWGTIAGLEYARRRGCRRFVFISSSGVYGAARSPRPLKERRALRSANAYAVAKICAEQFVSLYRQRYELDACSVRLAAPYGPWERPTGARTRMSLVYRVATAAARRQPIRLAGVKIARDWTYVDDVAAGLAHLVTVPTLPYDLFNLSNGKPVTLEKIARTIRRLVPGSVITITPPDQADVAMAPSDYRAPLDVSRLRAAGFAAKTSLDVGLRRYLRWLAGEGAFLLGDDRSGGSDGI